jgi:hypothetical protein
MIFSVLFLLFFFTVLMTAGILGPVEKQALKKRINGEMQNFAFAVAFTYSESDVLSESDLTSLKKLELDHFCNLIEAKLKKSSKKGLNWKFVFSMANLKSNEATLGEVLLWITDLITGNRDFEGSHLESLLNLLSFLQKGNSVYPSDTFSILIRIQEAAKLCIPYSAMCSLSNSITLKPNEIRMDFHKNFSLTTIPEVASLLNEIFEFYLARNLFPNQKNQYFEVISISHLGYNEIYTRNLIEVIENSSQFVKTLELVNVDTSNLLFEQYCFFFGVQNLNIKSFKSKISKKWVFQLPEELKESGRKTESIYNTKQFTNFRIPDAFHLAKSHYWGVYVDSFLLTNKPTIPDVDVIDFFKVNSELKSLAIGSNYFNAATPEFKGAIKSMKKLKDLSIPIDGAFEDYLNDHATFQIERLSFFDFNGHFKALDWEFLSTLKNLTQFEMQSDFFANDRFFDFICKDKLKQLSISKKQFTEFELNRLGDILSKLENLKVLALNLTNEHKINVHLSSSIEALYVDFSTIDSNTSFSLIDYLPSGPGVKYLYLTGKIIKNDNSPELDELKQNITSKYPNLMKFKVKASILESENVKFKQISNEMEPIYGGIEIAPGKFF